jgi:hypothetical protein
MKSLERLEVEGSGFAKNKSGCRSQKCFKHGFRHVSFPKCSSYLKSGCSNFGAVETTTDIENIDPLFGNDLFLQPLLCLQPKRKGPEPPTPRPAAAAATSQPWAVHVPISGHGLRDAKARRGRAFVLSRSGRGGRGPAPELSHLLRHRDGWRGWPALPPMLLPRNSGLGAHGVPGSLAQDKREPALILSLRSVPL